MARLQGKTFMVKSCLLHANCIDVRRGVARLDLMVGQNTGLSYVRITTMQHAGSYVRLL